ncbi:MAG TPA: acetate--CoA ligase [Spirochaetia bacterium]|nr:acetate--CoA ligase [Spirochaetia bacterium]
MAEKTTAIDDLLREEREFTPPSDFSSHAQVRDARIYPDAARDPVAWWAQEASRLQWSRPWDKAMEWDPPHARWFVGGQLNITVNCIDRHLNGPRRNKAALIWEGEDGEVRTLTYLQLHREVCKFANCLKALGVQKGDRVAIYMPMLLESAVAMLACARIGAVHNVVFGGFSPEALADRIIDSQAKVLITADGGWRRGNVVQLKHNADRALERCPSVQHVVIVKRLPGEPHLLHIMEGRDHFYHRIMDHQKVECPAIPVDAEDNLFILYTSGTTGKPKGIVHTVGGYAVGVQTTTRMVFDLRDEDVFWCTADIGWVTGHSYVVYGPLLCGATVLMYEGAPDFPERDRTWQLIEEHQVSVLYTAPTAIRTFMKWGKELPGKHNLTSLRLLGSVGEPINPEAWMWYHETIGGGRCPVVDTWWQTETGAIMITTLPGISTMKPGFVGTPLPGIMATVLDESGKEVKTGSGLLAITHPWPSMLRTVWGDDDRFRSTYFKKWSDKLYFPGDGAKRDAKGNYMILGRVDDVLNVSAHRIGTMEVESALVDHPAVAEAAVVGRNHDIKGQAIVAFVSLKGGQKPSPDLVDELKEHVVTKIGALARPEEVLFAHDLPKTRSGKIMRRLLRDIAEGRALGDVTTLADPAVVASLREDYEEKFGT